MKWFREVVNMAEITHEKIAKINRNPSAWNENTLPKELHKDCYNLALYNAQSLNDQDQEEQKTLYVRMFKSVKSYQDGLQAMYSWLEVDAFKHQDSRTHKVLQILQEARMSVKPSAGVWNFWYDAVAGAPIGE